MKVIFITNYSNFHQIGLWDSFSKNKDIEFTFLATCKELTDDRKRMHYNILERNYVFNSLEMSDIEISKIFDDCDVAILGSCEDYRIHKYLKKSKKLILACEHIFKSHTLRSFISGIKFKFRIKHFFGWKNVYVLSHSFYCYRDFKLLLMKKNNILKFGYFPLLPCISKDDILKKDKNLFLWSGRMINWKHPLHAIKIFEKFHDIDKNYMLKLIGDGPEKSKIENYIAKKQLSDCVQIVSFEPHEALIKDMQKSFYYLFTSDNQEGWGVVLNEAMSSGCLLISCSKAGSSPMLLKNGINGFCYKKIDEVLCKASFIESMPLHDKITIMDNAVKTIKKTWNCDIAAKNLYNFLTDGFISREGPLSKF